MQQFTSGVFHMVHRGRGKKKLKSRGKTYILTLNLQVYSEKMRAAEAPSITQEMVQNTIL